jgi:hypothetical protein
MQRPDARIVLPRSGGAASRLTSERDSEMLATCRRNRIDLAPGDRHGYATRRFPA